MPAVVIAVAFVIVHVGSEKSRCVAVLPFVYLNVLIFSGGGTGGARGATDPLKIKEGGSDPLKIQQPQPVPTVYTWYTFTVAG